MRCQSEVQDSFTAAVPWCVKVAHLLARLSHTFDFFLFSTVHTAALRSGQRNLYAKHCNPANNRQAGMSVCRNARDTTNQTKQGKLAR